MCFCNRPDSHVLFEKRKLSIVFSSQKAKPRHIDEDRNVKRCSTAMRIRKCSPFNVQTPNYEFRSQRPRIYKDIALWNFPICYLVKISLCLYTNRLFWNILYNFVKFSHLRILTGEKHPKIKLKRLRKIWILTFGSLVHQINSFQEVLKLEQIFQKNKVVTGKTLLFVIGPFCSRHSICLNIGFWQSSFEWKWCVFNLSGFN